MLTKVPEDGIAFVILCYWNCQICLASIAEEDNPAKAENAE